jgi:hypothetical protein
MSHWIAVAILLCLTLPLYGWQNDPASSRPSFAGVWQLDSSKSQTDAKDLVWKVDQKEAEITIEETSGGKALSLAKCPIGKPCEFEETGRKMGAMTYFNGKALVQTRSAPDNTTVIKRKMQLAEDGSLRVELITIVPTDKTEVLVFNKQDVKAVAAK